MKFGQIEVTVEDVSAFFRMVREIFIRLWIPRNKKNMVGIVVAISTENQKERERVQNDLINSLRMQLHSDRVSRTFNIIVLNEKQARRVRDYPSSFQYLKRTRGHFIVYGHVSERKIAGKPNFYFRLEGAVVHRPIPKVLSNQLAREFAELLPRKWAFPESEELLGFETTQQWIAIVAKYIIGIAAYVSGDFDLAFKIYSNLSKEIKAKSESARIQAVLEIKRRLPLRLTEATKAICNRLYYFYEKTREPKYIGDMKKYLNLMEKLIPDDYDSHIFRSIYYFLIEKDISAAKKELLNLRYRPNACWRYNLAFLYAYQGDLKKAKRNYDLAFEGYVDGKFVNEIEIFVSIVLEEEPDKYPLYFVRGYLNYWEKRDFSLAKEDFERFIQKADKKKYKVQVRLAKRFIKGIDQGLKQGI